MLKTPPKAPKRRRDRDGPADVSRPLAVKTIGDFDKVLRGLLAVPKNALPPRDDTRRMRRARQRKTQTTKIP